jgi:hypothetical protein
MPLPPSKPEDESKYSTGEDVAAPYTQRPGSGTGLNEIDIDSESALDAVRDVLVL